jgi:hypothetical protein
MSLIPEHRSLIPYTTNEYPPQSVAACLSIVTGRILSHG